MPTTLRNTDILFNDGSTQATAATAGGLVTTANVLNATAGATAGAVGTYSWLSQTTFSATTLTLGATFAGSGLRFGGVSVDGGLATAIDSAASPVPSGTWRVVGGTSSGNANWLRSTLFLRIS